MATMAERDPVLQRLFERLDNAPQPKSEALLRLMEHWTAKRLGRIAPSTADAGRILESSGAEAGFICVQSGVDRDYALLAGNEALAPLLGPCRTGGRLCDVAEPRGAVRLRRLFDIVRHSGEPLLAEFTMAGPSGRRVAAEIVVAPLSDDGRTVTAVLGGLIARTVPAAPSRPRRHHTEPQLFAFGWDAELGHEVAAHLRQPLSPLEERSFEDGEHKARPLVSVRGRDVYVVASLHGGNGASVNDRLCRLLFFVGALKTAGAARVTAVTPYLCYQRKDRQTKTRDPVTTRHLAQLIEAVGTDRLIAIEAHNFAAFQNAFRCATEHLDMNAAFVRHFAREIGDEPAAVVSPDLGGAKRAEAFRERLEAALGRPVTKGFMDKQRSMGRVTGELFAGDVEGRHVVVIDDLIASGTTMARVAAACRARGAARIDLAATHGLFAAGAAEKLADPAIARIVVADTVRPVRLAGPASERLMVLPTAPLIAEAIRRCHHDGSLVALSETGVTGAETAGAVPEGGAAGAPRG